MKRLSLTTAAAIAALAMTGAAQADTQDVAVSAAVSSVCVISGTFGDVNADAQVSSTLATIAGGASSTATTAAAYCNQVGASLSLNSANDGLVATGLPTASGTFATNKLTYVTTNGSWNSVPWDAQFDSDGNGGLDTTVMSTSLASTAINGNISFEVSLDAQSTPILAGTYSDTITVTITPGA